MSRRDRNSLGLVLLIVVIAAAFMFINPMFRYSWPRIFMHDFMGMQLGELPHATMFYMPGVMRGLPLHMLFFFFLWVAVTLGVYRDAQARGQNGLLWGLMVLVGNILGLIIYLIVRSQADSVRSPMADSAIGPGAVACPSCERPVRDNFAVCPYCGLELGKECRGCGKRVELDWRVCAYCGKPLGS
jgi:RNA polymerase subunit RPABC4/transcription elongation factor Spt4